MSTQQRDFSGMASRRREAASLFSADVTQAEVARRLKVSRQSVSRWYAAWKKSGLPGMAGAGRAGRKGKLSSGDLQRIEHALKQGPRANGLSADMWTLPRVRKLIKHVTGMSYGISGVWYVMQRLNWSVQRPGRRALQRDEHAIDHWRQRTWPAVKKTPDAKGD